MDLEAQVFTWVDWAIILAAFLFFALGAIHGLSSEIKSLVSWTVAPIIAFVFYTDLAIITPLQFITTASLRSVVAFMIIYSSVVFLLGMVLSLVLKVFMGPLAIFLSGFLALIKWIILFSFVTMMAEKSLSKEDLQPLHSAYFYSNIKSLSSTLFNKAEQGLKVARELNKNNGTNDDELSEGAKGYKKTFDKYKDSFKGINKSLDKVGKYQQKFQGFKKMNEEFDKYLPKDNKDEK